MSNKILSDINNFLDFINEYKDISEVSEISYNIGRIKLIKFATIS